MIVSDFKFKFMVKLKYLNEGRENRATALHRPLHESGKISLGPGPDLTRTWLKKFGLARSPKVNLKPGQ